MTDHPVIAVHSGSRTELRPLFELAEDSAEQLDSYVEQGDVLVARLGDEPIGHLQLVQGDNPGEVELKNIAVSEELQGTGIGRRLVLAAIELARSRAAHRITVATAAADVGNLRFYQRVGFRMCAIERDVFVPANGYPDGIVIDGIVLRDKVWLDLDLANWGDGPRPAIAGPLLPPARPLDRSQPGDPGLAPPTPHALHDRHRRTGPTPGRLVP